MAASRIPVQQDQMYAHGLLFLGVEPAVDFDRRDQADNQLRDKETGKRVWNVSVLDLTGRARQREILIKLVNDLQPKVPERLLVAVKFRDLELTPWVDPKGKAQMSVRATDMELTAK
jgi:hypothetical protein